MTDKSFQIKSNSHEERLKQVESRLKQVEERMTNIENELVEMRKTNIALLNSIKNAMDDSFKRITSQWDSTMNSLTCIQRSLTSNDKPSPHDTIPVNPYDSGTVYPPILP